MVPLRQAHDDMKARCALVAGALVASILACTLGARASVDMSVGIRYVMDTGTVADCGTKAQTALNAFLENATESPAGSGDWIAQGPPGGTGPATAYAVVRCTPGKTGYSVTFTCSVELPNNPYAANALCLDVAHNFSGKETTPLATPAPVGGCSPTNLVGTWTSSGSGPTFTMDSTGGVTDSDGVSGNWGLYGNTVTLTYYGTHTLTLSADGKHMTGGGYSLTRKC